MTINLLSHHILCSIGFKGDGYDEPFTANMVRIVMGTMRAPGGDDEIIQITDQADAICAPCPNRQGLGCVFQEKIDRLDKAHADALGLTPGLRLTWGEARHRVKERIRPEDLDTLCQGCEWLSTGVCKDAVAQLLEEDRRPPRLNRDDAA